MSRTSRDSHSLIVIAVVVWREIRLTEPSRMPEASSAEWMYGIKSTWCGHVRHIIARIHAIMLLATLMSEQWERQAKKPWPGV